MDVGVGRWVGVWVCMRVRMLIWDGGREELNLHVGEIFPCVGSHTVAPDPGEDQTLNLHTMRY